MGVRSTVVALAGHKSNGEPVHEELLIEVDDKGLTHLVATPALVLGVAAGDTVSVSDAGEVAVIERGRNLAVQVYAQHDAAENLVDAMAHVGGRVDSRAKGLTVFTVPVEVGFPAVEAILTAFVNEHPGAEWYFGNVYAEDGVTPLNWWV